MTDKIFLVTGPLWRRMPTTPPQSEGARAARAGAVCGRPTFDFFLALMRSCARRTTADLKMKTMVRISTFFLILPTASLAFNHLTVPYICSSDTDRFTA